MPATDALTLNRRAALASIGVSLLLVAAKTYGWVETGSLSLLSSLLDSSLDVLVSALNLFAVHYAARPEDDDHRFGHAAIEDIVGLMQAAFIGGSALFVLYEAIQRAVFPQPVQQEELGMGIAALSLVAALGVVLYQRRI